MSALSLETYVSNLKSVSLTFLELLVLAVASICVENWWGDGGARPEGPKPEARRAEAGGGILGEGGSQPPSPPARGSGGAL